MNIKILAKRNRRKVSQRNYHERQSVNETAVVHLKNSEQIIKAKHKMKGDQKEDMR